MKPICVPCQRFFRPKKNGFYFLEGMPESGNPKAGKAEADKWVPYKLWVGDKWECPDCHATIIVGVGRDRIAEHYQDDFDRKVKSLGADQFQVNDC